MVDETEEKSPTGKDYSHLRKQPRGGGDGSSFAGKLVHDYSKWHEQEAAKRRNGGQNKDMAPKKTSEEEPSLKDETHEQPPKAIDYSELRTFDRDAGKETENRLLTRFNENAAEVGPGSTINSEAPVIGGSVYETSETAAKRGKGLTYALVGAAFFTLVGGGILVNKLAQPKKEALSTSVYSVASVKTEGPKAAVADPYYELTLGGSWYDKKTRPQSTVWGVLKTKFERMYGQDTIKNEQLMYLCETAFKATNEHDMGPEVKKKQVDLDWNSAYKLPKGYTFRINKAVMDSVAISNSQKMLSEKGTNYKAPI